MHEMLSDMLFRASRGASVTSEIICLNLMSVTNEHRRQLVARRGVIYAVRTALKLPSYKMLANIPRVKTLKTVLTMLKLQSNYF